MLVLFRDLSSHRYFNNTDHRTPAATAEPITPATLGAIACISKIIVRIFLLSDHLYHSG